jgi:hypothetical protein
MNRQVLFFCTLAVSTVALAGQNDVQRVGEAEPATIRASENYNVVLSGSVPPVITAALDADDSTYNRLTSCTALSGVGTAVAFDTITISTGATAGNVTVSTELPAGGACSSANDTFMTLYSTFTPATPLTGCLAINDDIAGATNRCSSLTFALPANTTRTVVVSSFDNAATPTGLFPYRVNFTGTTGGGGGGPGPGPAAPIVQAPAFGTFGIFGMMIGFLGLGVFAARRYS